MNPKSYTNLKPWPKGFAPNPKGQPKLPEHLKAIKALTVSEVNRIISRYGRMTMAELLLTMKDEKNMQVVDRAICGIFLKSIKHGDHSALNFLLDRAIGKPKPVEEAEEMDNERERLSKLPLGELLNLIKKHIPDMKPENILTIEQENHEISSQTAVEDQGQELETSAQEPYFGADE